MRRHVRLLFLLIVTLFLGTACNGKDADSINAKGHKEYYIPPTDAPLFVNVWADWCEPCRSEIKILNEFMAETGVTIVGWHIDNPDLYALQQYQEAYGIQYPLVQASALQKIIALPEISVVPTTFVIKHGRIVASNYGPQTLESLRALFINSGTHDH